MLTGEKLLEAVKSLNCDKTVVSTELAKFLSQEACKDLDYTEIYEIAEEALTRRFMRNHTVESLCAEYGERYDYVFMEHGVDPMNM